MQGGFDGTVANKCKYAATGKVRNVRALLRHPFANFYWATHTLPTNPAANYVAYAIEGLIPV